MDCVYFEIGKFYNLLFHKQGLLNRVRKLLFLRKKYQQVFLMSLLKKLEDLTLMDLVYITMGAIFTLSILSCICCLGMQLSDFRMKRNVTKMAKEKGIKLDLDRKEPPPPMYNENCTIYVPDVGIII